VESAWRDERPTAGAWLLRALALPYAAASAVARAAAKRSRRRIEGATVIAIGGVTVGGAGKTTLARWAAGEALDRDLSPAIVLRGYGGDAARKGPWIVPEGAERDPGAARRYGDEAVAHRAALPPNVLVIAGGNRYADARAARDAGANVIILDDGWEQAGLTWDALWIVLDPERPFGNGRTLPAGPLRRRHSNLLEASAIALIHDVPSEGRARSAPIPEAGGRPVVRFQRRVASWSDRSGGVAMPPVVGEVLLVSSVGSPDRLVAFLAGSGVGVRCHISFPDHAAWHRPSISRVIEKQAATGNPFTALVAADKDAERARNLPPLGIPIRIVTSDIEPLDDPAPLLEALRPPAPGPAVPAVPAAPPGASPPPSPPVAPSRPIG
jgi:tetraacyldisaccharide 4'-kinase